MEIELKYTINSKEKAMQIWEDEKLKAMEEPDTRETIHMHATYFDTADYDLCKNDMAYRVRREGDRLIASLKWGGKTDGALHTREEINVPVMDTEPNALAFAESDIGRELISIIGSKKLRPIMDVESERCRFRIDTQLSLQEISIDSGRIMTEKGSETIREVEIELFSGEQEELFRIGSELMEKYELQSEKRSKFYRGLVLLGER